MNESPVSKLVEEGKIIIREISKQPENINTIKVYDSTEKILDQTLQKVQEYIENLLGNR